MSNKSISRDRSRSTSTHQKSNFERFEEKLLQKTIK